LASKDDKIKDDKIVIRIDARLKENFTKFVENKGLTVSNYIRQMIIQEMDEHEYQLNKYYSVKEQLSETYNPEINIYKELEILKDMMFKLEKKISIRKHEEHQKRQENIINNKNKE